jgi:hypothetical protein
MVEKGVPEGWKRVAGDMRKMPKTNLPDFVSTGPKEHHPNSA